MARLQTAIFWCAKLLPWGKFGALLLGEEEIYSGEFGASRAADRSVRSTRTDCWFPAGPDSNLRLGGLTEVGPFPNPNCGLWVWLVSHGTQEAAAAMPTARANTGSLDFARDDNLSG